LANDESALRNLYFTNIAFQIHQTFSALEAIAQELQILSLRPPTPSQDAEKTFDGRQKDRRHGQSSEKLDNISQAAIFPRNGPILSVEGKPLRPFTLLDNRQRIRDGVFRPDHSLPTMTIDEYLEEERKRGGIIEGGGEASMTQPEPNEDDMDLADQETIKARAWDEFKEENPKGSGNTLNRG
jgi:immunoglobulin-binding protein 1